MLAATAGDELRASPVMAAFPLPMEVVLLLLRLLLLLSQQTN